MYETMKVELTFTEPLLGTASANPELMEEFIASKAATPEATAEEVEALPDAGETLEKATTVFSRLPDGQPCLWDYQVKGFFKDACGMLKRVGKPRKKKAKDADAADEEASSGGFRSHQLAAHKKEVDGLIFPQPRQIPLILPEGAKLEFCERPLRAQTAQGERIALARSEQAPVGTKAVFEIVLLKADLRAFVEEWLDYGRLRGFGQWRNSGMGRFTWIELPVEA